MAPSWPPAWRAPRWGARWTTQRSSPAATTNRLSAWLLSSGFAQRRQKAQRHETQSNRPFLLIRSLGKMMRSGERSRIRRRCRRPPMRSASCLVAAGPYPCQARGIACQPARTHRRLRSSTSQVGGNNGERDEPIKSQAQVRHGGGETTARAGADERWTIRNQQPTAGASPLSCDGQVHECLSPAFFAPNRLLPPLPAGAGAGASSPDESNSPALFLIGGGPLAAALGLGGAMSSPDEPNRSCAAPDKSRHTQQSQDEV